MRVAQPATRRRRRLLIDNVVVDVPRNYVGALLHLGGVGGAPIVPSRRQAERDQPFVGSPLDGLDACRIDGAVARTK